MKLANIMPFIVMLPYVLCGLFLLLALFGFFDDRKEGICRFRARRFVSTIAIILMANIFIMVPVVYGVGELVKGAEPVAKTAVLKNRAIFAYVLNNISIMFPDNFNSSTGECYRAGLSNYVEDQWNKSFNVGMWKKSAEFCTNHKDVCDGSQENYYEAARKYVNPYHILFRDLTVIDIFLGSIWITAGELYPRLRQLFHEPDSKGNYQDPPATGMLAEYHHYLMECAAMKPVRWADPKADLTTSDVTFCVGACP